MEKNELENRDEVEYGEERRNFSNSAAATAGGSSGDDSDEVDDEEELSLSVVQRALFMRAAKLFENQNDGVGLDAEEFVDPTTSLKGDEEIIVPYKNVEAVELKDNLVLRKLLRRARYFDPDSWWLNSSSKRKRKPCFVCGDFHHDAQDCPVFVWIRCNDGTCNSNIYKSRGAKLCLKCGKTGHDMFSCTTNYSLDDLKDIQCYVCKSFGHLCCVNSVNDTPGEVSCYRCGRSGHTGLKCRISPEEVGMIVSPSTCFRCGERGHTAPDCTGCHTAPRPNIRRRKRANWFDTREKLKKKYGEVAPV